MGKRRLRKRNFKKIMKDANGSGMMTEGEIAALAESLNEKINIPILGEGIEMIIFAKVITKIDGVIYTLLPNEYYELIRSSADGVSDEEAEMIKNRLTPLINEKVNLPFLSEQLEAELIALVLGIIINALRKNIKLDEVKVDE